ncbi:Platelet glycoprotein V [Holothuria leucospilota]|uniref:Platelet glycoprotein V n=1 Tax=Holothuria leucospilota TaxID=206669 RepID=A0A9Q1H5H9_HOLLE|nr:Platelet glycoprotein V [Holothuria leucospilota]
MFLKMLLQITVLLCKLYISQQFCPDQNKHYNVYDQCEYPFPSGCCSLYSAFSCNGVNLTNASELGDEIPKSVDSVIIANSNTSFIKNGNWSFLSNLTDLKQLSFYNNNIKNISELESVYLENLHILETLVISRNNLKLFPVKKFSKLKTLTYLSLNCNNLQAIGEGPWNLPTLDTLQLNENQITSVREGQLKGLSNLTKLDLSYNRITYFSLKVLDSMPKLQVLEIFHNQLVYISEYKALHTNLYHVNLENNLFESIQNLAFTGLKELKSLIIASNRIKDQPNTAYDANMTSVRDFSLKLNKIEKLSPLFFDNFPGIDSISVSWNRIRHISESTFRSVPDITRMDLSHNEIMAIPRNLFQHLHDLNFIELQYNRIYALSPDVYRSLSKHTTLFLYDNPIVCNCSAVPLVKWLKGSETWDARYPTCQFPESLQNQKIHLAELPNNCSDLSLELISSATTAIPSVPSHADGTSWSKLELIRVTLGVIIIVCLSCLLFLKVVYHHNKQASLSTLQQEPKPRYAHRKEKIEVRQLGDLPEGTAVRHSNDSLRLPTDLSLCQLGGNQE